MNEIRLIFLAYLHNLVEWATTRLFGRRIPEYQSDTKVFFKRGEFVENKDGRSGRVWRIYVKIKTGEPVGCSIMWDEGTEGERITPFVSVLDKSPKFNKDGIRKLSI